MIQIPGPRRCVLLLALLGLLLPLPAAALDLCVDGMAGGFPCDKVDLLSRIAPAQFGAASVSDHWGWTDPLTGVEYAIVCTTEGTAFVDLADPENPVYLGTLPGTVLEGTESDLEPLLSPHHGGGENLVHIRDVKVYANHAFPVADLSNNGMQVFDLTQLRDVVSPPVSFSPDFTYTGISDAHNIAINEDTAFAYAVSDDTCSGGLHMIDISNPVLPTFAGCFSAAGSIHDVQCVVYAGPDVEHQGKEVCFASTLTGDVLTIVDVTDKANPVELSRTGYAGSSITHQGWLTEDHAFFLMGDEGDEQVFGVNTTTFVWDVSDLDLPVVAHTYTAATNATDHNQYVRGSFNYQGNYKAGLRVQAIDAVTGALTEVAFLDTRPGEDDTGFSGAWSTYPFFDSGITLVTDTLNGLFVVRANVDTTIFADGFESGDTSAWSGGP